MNYFEIRFSGEDIRRAGVDDSYYAILHLSGNELDTSATVVTSVYDHTDFREVAAEIVSLVSDQGVDTTDDGLYDYLEAQVSLEVCRDGDFQLRGGLEGGTSSEIAEYEHATLTTGPHTLTLKFNGIEVRESEVAGTFDLNLDLRDDFASCDSKTFTTSSYSYDAFDYRRVRFTDYFNDYGNDTNADGDYEWLTLEAGVETENAGNYVISAYVYDTSGQGGVGADTTVYLDAGLDTVQIDFSGSLLYYLQANGPYSVPYITIEDENGSPKDSREQAYLTSAYTYTDFEPPLLRSVGNYGEYVDPATPPYANLVVTVEVTAAEDGKVTAAADLYTASEVLLERNATCAADFTAETAQTLSFEFDGSLIWESQEDGPYNVKNLRIWHEADRTQEICVSEASTTAAYDYTDFYSRRSIYGFVTLSGEGLADFSVSLFNSSHVLLEEVTTEFEGEYIFSSYDPGDYIVEITAPLGYEADDESKNVTVVAGVPSRVDFALTVSGSGYQPQPDEYWLKQCNAYVYGKGKPQESIEDMELYMERIQTHFNNHPVNPVTVFTPDVQDDVYEQMRELLNLLNVKGQQSLEIRLFRQQFSALLMNLAAEYVNQSMEVNNDGATVSQAVTYCDEILDAYMGELYADAIVICENINTGFPVPDGYIPLSTPNILYKGSGDADRNEIPSTYSLSQNYPNPFNPLTEIQFALPQACDVRLEIFNIMGQRVSILVDRHIAAGYHTVTWDGTKFASGIYLYRLSASDNIETRKMMLVK